MVGAGSSPFWDSTSALAEVGFNTGLSYPARAVQSTFTAFPSVRNPLSTVLPASCVFAFNCIAVARELRVHVQPSCNLIARAIIHCMRLDRSHLAAFPEVAGRFGQLALHAV